MKFSLPFFRSPVRSEADESNEESRSLSPARQRRRRHRRLMYGVSLVLFASSLYFHVTNPFVRFTVIAQPFNIVTDPDQQIWLTDNRVLRVRENRLSRKIAEFKCGYHIISNVIAGSRKATAAEVEDIIADIHALRFNPRLPFLISGDHFSVLYPRSLGIFYHSLLDPRTALHAEDWFNRQALYLKTTAYALQAFADADQLTTTITPVGPQSVSLINFHRPPSDTLYSLLYALQRLRDAEALETTYPFPPDPETEYQVQTTYQANQLLAEYRHSLRRHLDAYTQLVYDPASGLVKKDLLLSSTKDASLRSSAFYDNVVFWKTYQLAGELGVAEVEPEFLAELKARIIEAFWLPDEGIFVEDLSPEALEKKYYSSDWLIVYLTGFLDPADPEEREYFKRSVAYIEEHGLNRPFGLWYQTETLPHRQYPLLRLAAPSYGTTSIWSNWGMEYTKLLARLYQLTGEQTYAEEARYQVAAYTENIKKYRGYPELYDTQGRMYQRLLYKSVRQTGWVVSFEQAAKMVESLSALPATESSVISSESDATPSSILE